MITMASKRGFGSVFQQKKRRPDGKVVVLPTWWVKFSKDGQIFRESSESYNKNEAEKLLKRRLGEVVTGKFVGLKPERIRFADLTKDVVEDYSDNGRKTVADVERRLRLHLLPALGDVRAANFGTAHLKKYIAKRREEGATNATINRELAIVKRAFRLAAQHDPPKVARIPHVSMLQENNVRKGFLDHDTYRTRRDELPEDMQPIFVVGYHTGARIGELRSLHWDQVDFQAKRIVFDPGTTKNKDARTLPIYGEMLEWLKMQKATREAHYPTCQLVFHSAGKPLDWSYAEWHDACERAGVAGLLFHDLRRTAVRNMVRAGIPERVAMQISGHKTRSIFDRYNITSDRDLTDAARKMEAHLSGSGILSGIPEGSEGKKRAPKKPESPLQ